VGEPFGERTFHCSDQGTCHLEIFGKTHILKASNSPEFKNGILLSGKDTNASPQVWLLWEKAQSDMREFISKVGGLMTGSISGEGGSSLYLT
jgi:hypothetical protein